ncbi:transmembrane p24 trafficking protein 3 [Rhinolophus ferrumequinum]|uniref:Transmembrane p24 trafficking protein 3 n=1 Tax=Rhinolophus ferrumequinum TaxID=59479 RepID=A0A7J7RBA4_RHIFE|nr:transmembrane p24 trafficking protein 3 [Rhinolophus ferrumequinum]
MGDAAPRFASVPSLLLPLLLLLLLRAERPEGTELTFELPDSAKQCFHEDVERGVRFSLDYQVGSRPPSRCRLAATGWVPGMGMPRAGPASPRAGQNDPCRPPNSRECRLRSSLEATTTWTALWRTLWATPSTGKPGSSTTASRTGLTSRVFISFASVMSFPPSLTRPSTSTCRWATSPLFSRTWRTGSRLSLRWSLPA